MHFKDKNIKGKKYRYAVESIRLPDGRIKKIEKIFKNEDKNKIQNIFDEKRKEEFIKFSINNYKKNHIFSEEQIKKIEEMKYNYNKLLRKIPKSNYNDLWDRFAANFTYESNALEGNSLTLKDVSMIMFENVSIKGKDLREIYETRNSREVVKMIIKNKFKINHEDIIKIHKILVKDLEIDEGYKKFPNVIIGKRLKTTPPEKVDGEMTKLIKWYTENIMSIHPLEMASIFHGKFEQIHPFADGNGRVGRFLINVILTNNKYPPLIIRKSQRLSYLTALEKFDDKHKDNLERFILEKYKETYAKFFEIYVKYL